MNLAKWLYRGGRPNWLANTLNACSAGLHALGIAPNYLVTLGGTRTAFGPHRKPAARHGGSQGRALPGIHAGTEFRLGAKCGGGRRSCDATSRAPRTGSFGGSTGEPACSHIEGLFEARPRSEAGRGGGQGRAPNRVPPRCRAISRLS